jgi:hypothetical protein
MVQEDGVKSDLIPALRGMAVAFAVFIFMVPAARAQQAATSSGPTSIATELAVQDLQEQVRQLRSLVEQMRAENAESRAEMHQLRTDLQETRALLERAPQSVEVAQRQSVPSGNADQSSAAVTQSSPAQSPELDQRVQKLEETTSLLGSKVDEQYQTKVETASKYRARLHGIILMNAFRNVGGSDNLDQPTYSEPVFAGWPASTMGATLRQSEIGLEVFGPTVFGAKSSADIQMDFSGGFPGTGNGVNFGIVRLQTASMRLDWANTSVVVGQDQLFISPLSPSSFASLAIPAFAFAGNLWGWTPQLRVEHRFAIGDQQTITMQAGVLDNLDWETPYNPFYRIAQAGEYSGQPAYAFRTAWSRPVKDHPLSFGVAGYYGRQTWRWNRPLDAWAGMADWQIPIAHRLSLSGEFYRGRGIGGLGGAIGTSVLYGGDPTDPLTPIRGLNTAGGWSQLKIQVTPKVELNGAVALDNAFASDARGFATDENNFGPILGRNESALANAIFRPRSDLVFSAELKRLRTFPVYSAATTTNQVNLSVGILF